MAHKKSLRPTLLPLLVVIGLIYGAGAHRPDIFIKEQIWDFGVLGWHQKITHNFVIENHGDVNLVIKGVRAFCGCTATLLDEEEIAPGDTGVIEVTFKSGHRKGEVKKFVWIESNDPDEPLIKLVIKGEVIPPSMANPFWAASHDPPEYHKPLTPSYNAFILVEPSSGKSLKTKQLKAIIRSRGGRLCHYFPPYAAFIYLPEGMGGELLKEESIKAIYRSEVSPKELKEVIADYGKGEHGKLLSYVAFVWKRNFVELEKRQKEVEQFLEKIRRHPELAPKPPVNDIRITPDYEKIRKHSKQPGVHPDSTETSLFMVRDVSVSIILPESNGSIDPNQEDWDNEDPWHPGEDRKALVLSEIQAGLDWYIDKEPLADLTFTYHFQVIETSYEPISREAGDKALWIKEIMDRFGYIEGYTFQRVRMYDNNLRKQDGTDWAFTIFVADSLNDEDGKFSDGRWFAWAYLGGPYIVMTYDNDNWHITKMDAVANHETGHIFQAADEYEGSGHCHEPEDCERTFGFLEVENQNCQLEACKSDVPCIMRGSFSAYRNRQVCYYTRGQIGWRDEDEDGIIDAIDSDYNPWGDSDDDGIVDYFDDCPNEYGPPENYGCGIPTIKLSSTAHDFGGVVIGSYADWSFSISNIGIDSLVVDNAPSDNPAFSILSPNFPQIIDPSDHIGVAVRFSPDSVASYEGKLKIISSYPNNPPQYISLQGIGIPSIELCSTSHDFGDVAIGSYADWSLRVSNIGGVLSVDSISSDNPVFTTPSPSFPQNVASYDSISITVKFAPTDKTSYTGKLTIFSNNPPQHVSLKGTATSAMGQTLSNHNVYAYPNPFNPENEHTKIRFALAKSANVTIKIFDSRNDLVKTLIENLATQAKAMQSIVWDGKNESGDIVSNGIYFFVITTDKGDKAIGKVAVFR